MTQLRFTMLGSLRGTWCLSVSTWAGRWSPSSSTCTASWTQWCRSRWSSPWMMTWRCWTGQWRLSTTLHPHNMTTQTPTGTMTSEHWTPPFVPWQFLFNDYSVFSTTGLTRIRISIFISPSGLPCTLTIITIVPCFALCDYHSPSYYCDLMCTAVPSNT